MKSHARSTRKLAKRSGTLFRPKHTPVLSHALAIRTDRRIASETERRSLSLTVHHANEKRFPNEMESERCRSSLNPIGADAHTLSPPFAFNTPPRRSVIGNAFEPVRRNEARTIVEQEARAAARDEHRERRENGTFLFGVADASVGRADCRGRSSRVGRLERRPGVSGSAERRRKRTKPEDPRSLRRFADVSWLGPRLRGITPPARETRVSEWLSLVSRAFPSLRFASKPACFRSSRVRRMYDKCRRNVRSSCNTLFFLSREKRSFELFPRCLKLRFRPSFVRGSR